MAKPTFLPTRCIFCTRTFSKKHPRSAEHIFPQWSHALLNRNSEPTFGSRVNVSFQKEVDAVVIAPNIRKRSGDPASIAPRVVCADCNGSWMSQFETSVRQSLTDLIQGNATTLTSDDQLLLSKWMAMKAMVGEYDDQANRGIEIGELHRFYSQRTLSPRWRVAIGNYQGSAWRLRYNHRNSIAMPASTPLEDRPTFLASRQSNTQVTIMGMSRVVLICAYSQVYDVTINFQNEGLRSIFPSDQRSLAWPPATLMDDAFMESFAQNSLVSANPIPTEPVA